MTVTLNKDGTPRNGGRVRADYLDDVERAWIPLLDRVGIQGLRDYFVDLGFSPIIAIAMAMFVADHRDLRPDHLSQASRTKYRRNLKLLTPPDPRSRVDLFRGSSIPAAA